MSQTLRFWSKSQNHPNYEVDDFGAIRKIGTSFAERLPRFWGCLDGTNNPEWLITIVDEKTYKTITIPTYEITDHVNVAESYYEE
jgi:hypothetical protein